jgi:DNA repair protein RecO (recombination protein O)
LQQIVTRGIVLSRTDYGEADRILHFLTPNRGKISAIAKGVRKSKSRLAGGIELFSVSDLSFIIGRSEIYTITSARLVKYYDNIVKDLERTKAGYEFIRLLNKNTEDNPEQAYFELLITVFEALDDPNISLELTSLWFNMQLIKLAGHTPNLHTDISSKKLNESKKYEFDFDHMQFMESKPGRGKFNANQIKFLRLLVNSTHPRILQKVEGVNKMSELVSPLITDLVQLNLRR